MLLPRSVSKRHLHSAVAALLLTFNLGPVPGSAQGVLDVDAFDVADDFITDLGAPGDIAAGEGDTGRSKEEPHTLHFGDGTSLRGRLAGIDTKGDVISWLRPDAPDPLQILAETVASLHLGASKTAAPSGNATVKFAGGDWITGEVRQIGSDNVTIESSAGAPLVMRRDQVEWIYFSAAGAAECYDGPTSLAGWVSDGSWTFQEGALRAKRPTAIGRHFETLPDQCEYLFDIEQQGDQRAFSLVLRNTSPLERGVGPGRVQIMFSGSDLRIWAQIGEEMKMEQVDLRKVLGAPANPVRSGQLLPETAPKKKTVRYRIFDDFAGGRIAVAIDGRKVAEWNIAKGTAGKNKGGVTFQPMVWNPEAQLSLTRVRVMPWDGDVTSALKPAEEIAEVDVLVPEGRAGQPGDLTGFDGTAFSFNAGGAATSVPAAGVRMVRFRRPINPPDEDPPVARLRLATGGEFDVSSIEIKEGQLLSRAAFCQDLKLAIDSLASVSFPGMASAPNSSADTLVFKTGDRLRGKLIRAGKTGPLLWQTSGSEQPVPFSAARIAGVVLARQQVESDRKLSAVARFRNGDMLGGKMTSLDAASIHFESANVGLVSIPRDQLQALYFAGESGLPIVEGSIDSESWTNGEDFRRVQAQRSQRQVERTTSGTLSPWRYFDGSYTYHRPDSAPGSPYNRANPFLGRIVEALPQNVELSFVVSAPESPTFSVQLFSDPGSPGYMMQFHGSGIYLHDMGPRPRGGGVFQQQIPFEGALQKEAKRRHVRIMADRKTGRLVVVIDGSVVTQIIRKGGDRAANLGQGIAFYPQMRNACTFSNIWLGPWDGRLPEAEGAPERLPHSVLLANGDEAVGRIVSATADRVQLETEVGELELPTSRLIMSRLAKAEPARGSARLRLVGFGTLTVSDFAVENGRITCKSAVAGALEFPLSALQEIAFANSLAKEAPGERN
jgi:hypothetical protein